MPTAIPNATINNSGNGATLANATITGRRGHARTVAASNPRTISPIGKPGRKFKFGAAAAVCVATLTAKFADCPDVSGMEDGWTVQLALAGTFEHVNVTVPE